MLVGEAKKEYQRAYMQKRRLITKNGDSAILAQKQGLENAPESATIDDNVTVDNVTPHIVTSNRNNIVTDKFPLTHKDAAGNDNHTDYEYRRTSQLEHVRLDLVYQMLKGPKLQNYLGLDLTLEQLEKQGYYWPYWLTENTASRDRDKEGRVKVA